MKRSLLIVAVVVAGLMFVEQIGLTAALAQGGASEYIDMAMRDAEITDVLKMIAVRTGVNIIHHRAVKGKLTLRLKDVHYEKALELICKTNGFSYRKVGNTYVIAPPKELEEGFEVGLNKTFRLQFADADDVSKILTGVFKGAASKVEVSVASRINAVVVTGNQATLEQVAKLIKTIDVPVHQVMIEAKIVEVSTEGMRDIGFDWDWGVGKQIDEQNSASGTFMSVTESMAPIPNIDGYDQQTAPDNGGASFFKFGDFFRSPHFFQGTLTALEKISDAKTLSNPKVSALNGEEATIHIGQKVIYGGGPDNPPQEKDVGVILKVTPRINDDGWITCAIEPEVSFAIFEGQYPRIEKRTANTTVRVRDGEEILIGGLIQETDTNSNQKIPVLGSIPILKTLFSRDTRDRDNMELIILITPHIMRATGERS